MRFALSSRGESNGKAVEYIHPVPPLLSPHLPLFDSIPYGGSRHADEVGGVLLRLVHSAHSPIINLDCPRQLMGLDLRHSKPSLSRGGVETLALPGLALVHLVPPVRSPHAQFDSPRLLNEQA